MEALRIRTAGPVAEADDAATSRGDALPEHSQYRDEGCELSPSCLNCALPLCRYDQPGGVRRLRARGRDEEIVRLRRRQHLPIDALARRFGVSRRTIFRILERNNHCKAPVRPQPNGHQQDSFAHPRRSAESLSALGGGRSPLCRGSRGVPLIPQNTPRAGGWER